MLVAGAAELAAVRVVEATALSGRCYVGLAAVLVAAAAAEEMIPVALEIGEELSALTRSPCKAC